MRWILLAVVVAGCGPVDSSVGVPLENGAKCDPGEYGWGKCKTPTSLASCEADGGIRVYECGRCEASADGTLHCFK